MARVVAIAAAAVLALSGCTPVADGRSFELVEFEVDGPATLSTSTTSVDVTNSGQFPHTLVVTDTDGSVVAATSLIQPGETAGLELDLKPGAYSFTCRIVAQDSEGAIIDHFEAGMHATVSVED